MYQTPIVILFVLIFSLSLLLRLAPGIIPPKRQALQITPADEIYELSLFRRAAAVNRRPKSTPKISFLFLTTSSLSFSPLWHRFFSTPTIILTLQHLRSSQPQITPSLLTGVFAGKHIANRQKSSSPEIGGFPEVANEDQQVLNDCWSREGKQRLRVKPFCIALSPLLDRTKSIIHVLHREWSISFAFQKRFSNREEKG